jgi:hypothetical protein
MIKKYLPQIKDADLVLVGIGQELHASRLMDFSKEITAEGYQKLLGKEDEKSQWMRTVYERSICCLWEKCLILRSWKRHFPARNTL